MNGVKSNELDQFSSLTKIQSENVVFNQVLPPHLATKNSLTFVSTPEMFQQAELNGATGFIILAKFYDNIRPMIKTGQCVWTTPQINQAMSEVLHLFDQKKIVTANSTLIHPTAVVHSSAQIGQNVIIGAHCVVEENCIIEDNCFIDSLVVVKKNAHIGSFSQISAHSVVGSFCKIGRHCIISSHVTIGSDGFGFFSDKQNNHHKIPQIGIVVVEDHCEIGAHCAIDRATLTETRIKKGSKLDNFCHIAHNCEIGENALLAAGFMVAGSTKIGKNLTSAGGVQVNGHISITDNVILTARSGIVGSLKEPGFYGGFPELPHKENLKVMMSLSSLPKIRKQVSKILKHLGLSEE